MYALLVADDEALVRQGIIARLASLQATPARVLEASNGLEALNLIRLHRPQIVITDIRMPYMDGLALIAEATKLFPDTRFILLSGYADFEYAKQAIRLGVSSYLLKPVTNETLFQALSRAISQLNARQEETDRLIEIERMRDDLGILDRQQKFYRLLHTGVDDPASAFLHQQLFGKAYRGYILAIARLDARPDEDDGADLTLAEWKRLFAACPQPVQAQLFTRFDARRSVYAVFAINDEAEWVKRLAGYFERIIVQTRRSQDACMTIGMSELCAQISPRARTQAAEAFQQHLTCGHGRCYPYARDGTAQHAQALRDDLAALQYHIERMECSAIEPRLREMFSEKRTAGASSDYILIAWFRIVCVLMQLYSKLPASAAPSQESMRPDMLDRFHTKEEFISYLSQLIYSAMQPDAAGDMRGRSRITLALQYINEHYQEELTVNDLSCQYAFSPSYFSAAFKKETGVGVVTYITGLRVQSACALLRSTSLSVNEIARRCGYSDSQYFFRVFKRTMGTTPLLYRREKASPV